MTKRKLNFAIWGIGIYTVEFDEDMTCSQVVEQLIDDEKISVKDGTQPMVISGKIINKSTLVKDIPEGIISFKSTRITNDKNPLFPIFMTVLPR
ncbi:MAG: hypothetical protein ACTSRA_00550 [Promethearchaeota archaeon]|nr:MAG: hypothetical protein [Helarchaeota virus Nidhogg Meg22_1012]URC17448.1 MAG: hypothetical protein [Helarchaeota virus Nidhogg Meg22_1214]